MIDTEALLLQGAAALEDGDPERAAHILRRAVAADPDDSDVRHMLGLAYEELGMVDAMKREFLQVRLLDAEQDRRLGVGDERDIGFIENVAVKVLASLPDPFRSKLAHVPLVLERRPSLSMVRSGFDPRALGLFEGASIIDEETELPARVVVFTHNLLAEAKGREELAEQIEITILHEVGHYFGLEEEDMPRLGLE